MPDPNSPKPPGRAPSPLTILLIPIAVALVLTSFAWPTARLEPRELPVGLAGESSGTESIERQLAAGEGSFDIHRYPDEAAAREAIEQREVYGAFVSTGAGTQVLTASAAAPTVAQLLEQAAESGSQSAAAQVEDVVSPSENDPRGAALPASVLPLVLGGTLTGLVATLLAGATRRRAGLVLAGSALAGLAATGIVQGWLGVVEGDWPANWGALSLTVLAIGSVVAGLATLLGRAGLALGAVTMVVLGNAFSAASSAPEMLPRPIGAIGQLLPPGAGANLLRSTGFFDGAAASGHVAVLASWVLAGVAALIAAGVRDRRAARAGASVGRPEPDLRRRPSPPTPAYE
jgi:hypothetical protein